MPRVCKTLGIRPDGEQVQVTLTRLDEPRISDGCQYLLEIGGIDCWAEMTVDLTQTITRMMEAEVACQSRAYLLACSRAGCQPAWSPPAGGPGDPEPDCDLAAKVARLEAAVVEIQNLAQLSWRLHNKLEKHS